MYTVSNVTVVVGLWDGIHNPERYRVTYKGGVLFYGKH